MIHILLMCYNSEKFIKQVIESWRPLGTLHVFVDSKTNDSTKTILSSMKVKYQTFEFVDFATSRNRILSKFPSGYRIFIDDSYLFIGDVSKFKRELLRCNRDVVSVRITKDNQWFHYSKITRGINVFYSGAVHEFINRPSEYQMTSGYVRELSCSEHWIRTLKRIPWDYEIMLNRWYQNPSDYRNVFYISRSLLLFRECGQTVETRLVEYWLIQLITACPAGSERGAYMDFALENLRRINSSKICA